MSTVGEPVELRGDQPDLVQHQIAILALSQITRPELVIDQQDERGQHGDKKQGE
jgi:hypothetical protein